MSADSQGLMSAPPQSVAFRLEQNLSDTPIPVVSTICTARRLHHARRLRHTIAQQPGGTCGRCACVLCAAGSRPRRQVVVNVTNATGLVPNCSAAFERGCLKACNATANESAPMCALDFPPWS